MVNHELSTGEGGARVSRMAIDTKTLEILDHSYPVDGSEGHSRLCSAEWGDAGDGFPGGYFSTGEEFNNGLQLAIDAQGRVTEMPHVGKYAHENQGAGNRAALSMRRRGSVQARGSSTSRLTRSLCGRAAGTAVSSST